jgi:hypothetical protein
MTIVIKYALLLFLPVVGQDEALDIHLINFVQQLFQLADGVGVALEPGNLTVENVLAAENFTDLLEFGKQLILGRIVLTEQSLTNDLLRQVIITLVQRNAALSLSKAPGLAGLIKLCKNALVAHTDTESYLRCLFGEAVFLVCKFIIMPKTFEIYGQHKKVLLILMIFYLDFTLFREYYK